MTSLTTQNLIYSTSVVAMEGKPNKFAFSLGQGEIDKDRRWNINACFSPIVGCVVVVHLVLANKKQKNWILMLSKEHMANQISVTQ